MNIFRLRDLVSVLAYRLAAMFFGAFGRRVRVVWPMRLVGVRHMHFADDVTIANGGYLAALPEIGTTPKLTVGRGSRIGELSHIICAHSVTIGEDVLIANRVFISDCSHRFADPSVAVLHQGLEALGPVMIGDGSWVGENACIFGATIGKQCVVGANSVVMADVPDHCMVVGSPGRIVKRYCPQRQSWCRTDASGAFAEAGDV